MSDFPTPLSRISRRGVNGCRRLFRRTRKDCFVRPQVGFRRVLPTRSGGVTRRSFNNHGQVIGHGRTCGRSRPARTRNQHLRDILLTPDRPRPSPFSVAITFSPAAPLCDCGPSTPYASYYRQAGKARRNEAGQGAAGQREERTAMACNPCC